MRSTTAGTVPKSLASKAWIWRLARSPGRTKPMASLGRYTRARRASLGTTFISDLPEALALVPVPWATTLPGLTSMSKTVPLAGAVSRPNWICWRAWRMSLSSWEIWRRFSSTLRRSSTLVVALVFTNDDSSLAISRCSWAMVL